MLDGEGGRVKLKVESESETQYGKHTFSLESGLRHFFWIFRQISGRVANCQIFYTEKSFKLNITRRKARKGSPFL